MASILQDIDNSLNNGDELAEDRIAINHAVCYFAYCINEQLNDAKNSPWSDYAYIELPECDLLRLERLGYITFYAREGMLDIGDIRRSVYYTNNFYLPEILTTVKRFKLDVKLRDEYFKFLKKDKEYKSNCIAQFLNDIQDYINYIKNEYYNNLSYAC